MLDATWAVLMMHAATVTSFGAPAWYLLVHVLSLSAVSFYYRRYADTLTVVFVILLIPGIIWGCYARAKLGSPDNATTASGISFIILIDGSMATCTPPFMRRRAWCRYVWGRRGAT